MKKRFALALGIAAVLIVCGVAVFAGMNDGNANTITETTGTKIHNSIATAASKARGTPTPTARETARAVTSVATNAAKDRQPYIGSALDKAADDYLTMIQSNMVSDDIKSLAPIPVFKEEAIFFDTEGFFYLNRDACFYEGLGSRPNYTGSILLAYPTTAIRERQDGSVYACYATDTGYRMYMNFSTYNRMSTPDGFPVVIRDMLSYDSFRDLQVGDPIETVEAIDSVATLHKKVLLQIWKVNTVAVKNLAEMNHPCCSIHYLKDGILKIEYAMPEDGKLVISNMIYCQDYKLKGATGRTLDYRINDPDLPGAK